MSRDLRRYTSQTNRRLMAGFVIILLVVGDGIIYLIYGASAAAAGLICTLAGLAPLLLISLSLTILERIAKNASER